MDGTIFNFLRTVDMDIHIQSRYHRFLGVEWWSSRVAAAEGFDLIGTRTFHAFRVEDAEAKAERWYRKQRAKKPLTRVIPK